VGFDAAGNLYIADNNNNRVRRVDANGLITTVAGNGHGTYSGDGGAATNTGLYRPNNVGWDSSGNLYIADIFNQRIRQVNTSGIITTVAGNGAMGYNGDGKAATNANLTYPASVVFDAAGNLYIADHQNMRVRKVDTNGMISTVAGNGIARYSGDGGAATNASLSYLQDAAFDLAGNLYIADTSNNRIRKVDTNGIITTVAGTNSVGYSGDGGAATNASLDLPWFVAFDVLGDFYIADLGNNRVRKVDTNGIISTVAGNGSARYSGDGGAATNASLNSPACVALDALGNLYIADWYNNRIREVHFAGFPTLVLTNVSTNNTGNYTVVVTSPYGSVTSAVVTLTVAASPPQIMTSDGFFGFVTNQFGFNVSAAAGQTIVVDGSTDLVNWTPVFTNTAGVNPFYFCDPCWSNSPWRFYRARLP
jgi:sugar lactone lactonase YvrE